MKCFHFTNGLLISSLALAAAACSSSTSGTTTGGKDGGAGGASLQQRRREEHRPAPRAARAARRAPAAPRAARAARRAPAARRAARAARRAPAAPVARRAPAAPRVTPECPTRLAAAGDAGGPDGSAPPATCASYCTANLAACTGTANSRYASRDACLTACAATNARGATVATCLKRLRAGMRFPIRAAFRARSCTRRRRGVRGRRQHARRWWWREEHGRRVRERMRRGLAPLHACPNV